MTLFTSQYGLLRRAPGFRALFLATAASGFGTYLALVALMIDVYDRTGSGSWVAAVLIVEFLPVLVIGLALGPFLDRLPRRTLMVASDLVRFGVFAALPFTGSALSIVLLAAVAGFATGFFRPAVYAGLPNLVDDDDLPQANSLLQAVESLTALVPLAGGAIVAAVGPDPSYVINAVTFLASAAFVLRIPAARLQQGVAASEGHLGDLKAGFRAVTGSRALLAVLVAWTIVMVGNGTVNVSEIVLAKDAMDGGDFGFGLLMAGAGLGLMVGSLLGGAWVERRPMAEAYGGAIALMAVGAALAAISPTVWVAVWFVVAFGMGNGLAVVCNAIFVQRGAPDHLRGRVFTVIMSVNAAVLGLAMVGAGPFTDEFGARWAWAAAASAYALAATAALVLARPIRGPAHAEDVEPVGIIAP